MKPDIRALAAECGLSQAEFARVLGKRPGSVNRWFTTGRRDAVEAPAEVYGFLLAFRRLSEADRVSVMAEMKDVRDA